jgi:hypothetical protein
VSTPQTVVVFHRRKGKAVISFSAQGGNYAGLDAQVRNEAAPGISGRAASVDTHTCPLPILGTAFVADGTVRHMFDLDRVAHDLHRIIRSINCLSSFEKVFFL